MGQETITLTSAEMKKVLVVEKILDGHMTNAEGAAVLGITPRQVVRLKKKYLEGEQRELLIRTEAESPFMLWRIT